MKLISLFLLLNESHQALHDLLPCPSEGLLSKRFFYLLVLIQFETFLKVLRPVQAKGRRRNLEHEDAVCGLRPPDERLVLQLSQHDFWVADLSDANRRVP